MEQKKDFLDELEQTLMMIMIVAATVCTMITFACQFFSAEAVALFKQLSFYAYGWMVFLALGPAVKRGAFMRIDMLANKYPQGVKNALKILTEGIMVVLMLELCVFSWYNVMHLAELTPSFKPACAAVPLAVAYFAPAVGYTLAMLAYMKKYLVKGEGKK